MQPEAKFEIVRSSAAMAKIGRERQANYVRDRAIALRGCDEEKARARARNAPAAGAYWAPGLPL